MKTAHRKYKTASKEGVEKEKLVEGLFKEMITKLYKHEERYKYAVIGRTKISNQVQFKRLPLDILQSNYQT
jgi:hypothetical protein